MRKLLCKRWGRESGTAEGEQLTGGVGDEMGGDGSARNDATDCQCHKTHGPIPGKVSQAEMAINDIYVQPVARPTISTIGGFGGAANRWRAPPVVCRTIPFLHKGVMNEVRWAMPSRPIYLTR
mmetsp:Transcript_70094/g.116868  ORF Transcript_70094/g.116868 Transcript_70094/m.116868 type:complete len:123 (-) Transcript_70094:2209-2577(-)